MSKVKLNHAGSMPAQDEMPSAQIVRAAQQEVVVKDVRNRLITLRKPGLLAQYRLVEALGDSAKNETYMGMVMPLIFVTKIDDVPAPMPSNKAQIEALISRLESDGLEAVVAGITQHFVAEDRSTDEAIKKS